MRFSLSTCLIYNMQGIRTYTCENGPQIIKVACSVKLNHSCRFNRRWRVSASAAISGRPKNYQSARQWLLVSWLLSFKSYCRPCYLQYLCSHWSIQPPIGGLGIQGDLLPFWEAVFDAHFPPLHILPLRRHPSRLSAPNRPLTPPFHFDK